jgi:hypothetical protein
MKGQGFANMSFAGGPSAEFSSPEVSFQVASKRSQRCTQQRDFEKARGDIGRTINLATLADSIRLPGLVTPFITKDDGLDTDRGHVRIPTLMNVTTSNMARTSNTLIHIVATSPEDAV